MTDCTEIEARDLVDGIRRDLGDLAERIERAYTGRAWLVLGYADWSVLCAAEFGGVPRLPAGERRPVVRELTGAGMSTRAIGEALGVDNTTVHRDRSSVANATDGARVLSLDGRSRPMTQPPRTRPDVITPPPVAPTAQERLSRVESAVSALTQLTDTELATAHLYTIQGTRAVLSDLARKLDQAETIRRADA